MDKPQQSSANNDQQNHHAHQQRKQKRLGPAPIASFEDTSDEVKQKLDITGNSLPENRLPEIREHETPTKVVNKNTSTNNSNNMSTIITSTTTTVTATTTTTAAATSLGVHIPSTPRIDISRASSSSHHEDSRDSSPENVFEQVGTGTLQETTTKAGLGFHEDGTMDLRSSTEELYFMETEKEKNEQDKFTQQIRRSPISFKFDEHQACLQQNQRKDSASSEVAALLCISGRTSRISSVGSQGSALSRLSAVSGISRSPSPHKMLLETSFCGPKPLDNVLSGAGASNGGDSINTEILEQVLLARKHDPTQAVFAEGIHIDTSTPKKHRKDTKHNVANGKIIDAIQHHRSEADGKVAKVQAAATTKTKGGGILANTNKPIVGKTSSGIEYIRIKLKPDHLYSDKGLGQNEKILDDAVDCLVKKPATLSLGHDTPSKKAAPHFSQLVQSDDAITKYSEQRLTPCASPKPSRHIALRDTGSRSPSPATVSVSRKSSFCSLFKSKDAIASPESPTVIGGQRKKSNISLLNDSPRDRSRSKSRENDRSSSQNTTPSKQKSVLAIFKPKRSGSKSKSASPVDPEAMSSLENIEFRHISSPQPIDTQPKVGKKLRYYEAPLDGKSIHIPLHTPPDEKNGIDDNIGTVNVINERRQQNETREINAAKQPALVQSTMPLNIPRRETPSPAIGQSTSKPIKSNPSEKVYRIENADGSIRIPLRSPSSETTNNIEEDSMWSVEVQRNSSLESQETVISTPAPSIASIEKQCQQKKTLTKKPSFIESEPIAGNGQQTPASPGVPLPGSFKSTITTTTTTTITTTQIVPSAPAPTPTTSASATKEKKRILFCTKFGSGSEEQLFATQLSLSKTESLCSQLSEQTLDSPAATDNRQFSAKTSNNSNNFDDPPFERSDASLKKFDDAPISSSTSSATVLMRNKADVCQPVRKSKKIPTDWPQSDEMSDDFNPSRKKSLTDRHSRYIDNIDDIMAQQKQLDRERKETFDKAIKIVNSSPRDRESHQLEDVSLNRKPEPVLQIPSPPTNRNSMLSTDDRGRSSESEMDSELNVKKHIPLPVGSVEEDSTGLINQESFDDELPYIPTTLPEERSVGVAIISMKERSLMEVKTCPVERPRSTTPMNPSYLEDYCGISMSSGDDTDHGLVRGEKLRISLPRKESRDRGSSISGQIAKSPRRISNASGKSWFEFAEQGIGGAAICSSGFDRRNSNSDDDPPPLPPRKPQNVSQWINFENIPEKRKQPKRITTLPNKESTSSSHNDKSHQVQYNYVNPEECQCECHESERDSSVTLPTKKCDSTGADCPAAAVVSTADETLPLIDPEPSEGGADRNSMSDLSSLDISFGHPTHSQHVSRSRTRGEKKSHCNRQPFGNNDGSSHSSATSQDIQPGTDEFHIT